MNLKANPGSKKIAFAVTNDIATDQRVHRIGSTLIQYGLEITLAGRWHKGIHMPASLPFRTVHLNPFIQKGFLFYAIFNIQLFFYLLFHHFDAVTSNDLDTLTACFLASRIKRVPLLYDSHEFFTELPELVDRPMVRKIWKMLEKSMVPKIRHCYTVSKPIAEAYEQLYGVNMKVVRNLPKYRPTPEHSARNSSRKRIIYQGSINVGRGIESVILALHHLKDVEFIVAGDGYLREKIHQLIIKEQLADRVILTGRLLPEELYQLTITAHLGISLEQPLGLNYIYALPNKLFDYIQARIPVLVSDFPAMKEIVNTYNIGYTTDHFDPEHLADCMYPMLFDEELRATWKNNLEKAARDLCWENEEKVLLNIYEEAGILKPIS